MLCRIIKDEKGVIRIQWRCIICGHSWKFHAAALEDIGFFVTHHLITKHRMGTGELQAYNPLLKDVLQEYPEMEGVCAHNARRSL